jgi:hypothetical protein
MPRPIVTRTPRRSPPQGTGMRTFAVPDRSDRAELAEFASASPFCQPPPEIDLYFLQDRTPSATRTRLGNHAGEFANQLSDQHAPRKPLSDNQLSNTLLFHRIKWYAFAPSRHTRCICSSSPLEEPSDRQYGNRVRIRNHCPASKVLCMTQTEERDDRLHEGPAEFARRGRVQRTRQRPGLIG